jgi:uncharacterized protein (DUF362 family)
MKSLDREAGQRELSRRHFLAAVSLPLLAPACLWRPYDRGSFSIPERSAVGLFPASHYSTDFADLVYRGLRELGASVKGRRVFLKPNMVEYEPGTAINTHPQLVAGAAIACRRAGASEVVIGEGPGHRRDIEYLLTATGLADQLREQRIRFVDLNHDDVRMVRLNSWFTGLRELALPVELLKSDFIISMPKLKTHHWAGITCSMKNLFGTVPGAVYGWPMGQPRALGFIAMGSDLVAVDATCARVIGLDPVKIDYLRSASRFLGVSEDARIDQRGESPLRYATEFDVVDDLKHLRLS